VQTVIIVDDQSINRIVLRTMLEALGVEVFEANDGVDGLAMLSSRPFDLLLSDIHMPQMGGVEMVRQMREGGGPNRDIAVVAVTADTTLNLRDLAVDGFDGFLAKPITVDGVTRALATERGQAARPVRRAS
jgi:CheY-like chemotaxis protein